MANAIDPELGKGKLLDRVKIWSDTKIIVKLKVGERWAGKAWFLWVEKDGYKSAYQKLRILAPATLKKGEYYHSGT